MRKFIRLFGLLLFAVMSYYAQARPKKLTPTITWELHKNGTLEIKGQGRMPDFNKAKDAPWYKKSVSTKINQIIIRNGITHIGDRSFYRYDKDRYKLVENITLPSTLRSIGYRCFSSLGSVSQIQFPKSLDEIESYAFYDTGLYSIEIPIVNFIGERAFAYNKFSKISFPYYVNAISWSENVFQGCRINEISFDKHTTRIPNNLCQGAIIKTIVIPEGVQSIGNNAFSSCEATWISLPKTLKTIGDYAFAHNNLALLKIPDGVNKIGEGCFYKGLTSYATIHIPESINSIGRNAFLLDNKFNGTIAQLPKFITSKNVENIGISLTAYKEYRPSASDYYNKGTKLYKQNKYSDALKYFLKGAALEEDSENSSSYIGSCCLYAGWCYSNMTPEDIDKEIQMHERGVLFGDALCALSLSQTYLYSKEKQDIQRSIHYAKKALELSDNDNLFVHRGAYFILGQVNQKYLKDWDEAIYWGKREYELSLKQNFDTGGDCLSLGQLYEEKKDYYSAKQWYQRVIDKSKDEDSVSKAKDRIKAINELTSQSSNQSRSSTTQRQTSPSKQSQGSSAEFYEISKTFFNTNKTYKMVASILIPLGLSGYNDYSRNNGSFTINNNRLTYKYPDGSGNSVTIYRPIENVVVITSKGDVTMQMYKLEDGTAVRAVKYKNGDIDVHQYSYNRNSKKYTHINVYVLKE